MFFYKKLFFLITTLIILPTANKQKETNPMNDHEPRICKLETRTDQHQEEIQELKKVDNSLQKTLNNLDKTVTRFSTIVENLVKNNDKETIWDKIKAPIITAIIVAITLKIMQWY